MKAKNLFMALAAVAALGAGAAHAGNVVFSVGLGVPLAPVVLAPQPVYYQAPPVAYVAPRVVVGAPVLRTAWVEPRFYGYRHDWRGHEHVDHERFEHRGFERR